MTYDLIIIGGGPAGTAAAVYAARKRLKTLFITPEWGGQSVVSEQIYNWIGTTSLSGNDLAQNFKKHVEANVGESLEIKAPHKAKNVVKNTDGTFDVETERGETFTTKTILVASGSSRKKLPAKNADKFENKGLTYCASCDGPLFADMDVAVIGGGNAGFESAAQLLAYCKSVTLLSRGEFRADEVTVEKVLKNPKMHAIKNVEILEVNGDQFVEGLIYREKNTGEPARNAAHNAAGGEKELKVSGIFVEIGQIPNTDYVKGLVELDELGRVKIDPRTQKTGVPGIWAAGDCTDVLYHQNNIAAGDAVRALEDIYLAIHTK